MRFSTSRSLACPNHSRNGMVHGGLVALVAVWVLLIGTGVFFSTRYQFSASEIVGTSNWPADCGIHLAPEEPTLVLFVHPRCPCTRATLAELSRITGEVKSPFRTYVVSFVPTGIENEDDWKDTDITRAARSVTGVQLVYDLDGKITKSFQAAVSGETMLFGPSGTIQFHGGLTHSRGHLGPSVGSQSVARYLSGAGVTSQSTLVFGCPILAATERQIGSKND